MAAVAQGARRTASAVRRSRSTVAPSCSRSSATLSGAPARSRSKRRRAPPCRRQPSRRDQGSASSSACSACQRRGDDAGGGDLERQRRRLEQRRRARARSARCRGRRWRRRVVPTTRRRKATLVCRPDDVGVAQRRVEPRQRLRAVVAPDDQLGDHRVVVRADRVAFVEAAVDAHRRRRRGSARRRRCAGRPRARPARHRQRAGGGQEVGLGVLGADARLDRVAADASAASCVSGSGSPAATRSCHSTRSRPVIASVTGCSTCSRVFISMK